MPRAADNIVRIALTPGEPAGIGPDLTIQLAQQSHPFQLIAIGDPELLQRRAALLRLPLLTQIFDPNTPAKPQRAGTLTVLPVTLRSPVTAGKLDPSNAAYVLDTLAVATDLCLQRTIAAVVTGPVQKSVINDAGIAFSGHTEYFAERSGTQKVVMMLATEGLRVALATTHLPLKDVSAAITEDLLEQVIAILVADLRNKFGIAEPRILVCGLNPHAGEGGHLGREEIDIIIPVLDRLRGKGRQLVGPLPADTLFTPHHLNTADAVLAMYHDQGLPVLKYRGFGNAVNITLGLPFIRTSVDHGTALDLAGTGKAHVGSLAVAIQCAQHMTTYQQS